MQWFGHRRARARLEARKAECDRQAEAAELVGEAYSAMKQTGAATEAFVMATTLYREATEIENLLTAADAADALRRAR